MRWKLAIFDKDGTLVDTLTVAYAAVRKIFEVYAPGVTPPTLDDYRREITADFKHFYYKHGVPRSVTPDDMDFKVWVPYFRECSHEIKPYPGAIEVLELCRALNMRVAIVSASPEDLEREFTEWGMIRLIDRIQGRAHDKKETLLATVNFFGLKAEEAFYCDDTHDGLVAAKNAGMTAIGVTHGYNIAERIAQANPDFIASNLAEVIAILANQEMRP